MSCGPEREDREDRYFAFFRNSPTIETIGQGRLRLLANGTELILERPALRRLANLPAPDQLRGSWRMLQITRYLEGGGQVGTGLSELPGHVEIGAERIAYSACPRYAAAYRLSAEGQLVRTGGTAPPPSAAESSCPELNKPGFNPDMPTPWDILRLLHASPAVERVSEDTILLSAEGLGLLLTSAPPE
jgi:hypothetical protein